MYVNMRLTGNTAKERDDNFVYPVMHCVFSNQLPPDWNPRRSTAVTHTQCRRCVPSIRPETVWRLHPAHICVFMTVCPHDLPYQSMLNPLTWAHPDKDLQPPHLPHSQCVLGLKRKKTFQLVGSQFIRPTNIVEQAHTRVRARTHIHTQYTCSTMLTYIFTQTYVQPQAAQPITVYTTTSAAKLQRPAAVYK